MGESGEMERWGRDWWEGQVEEAGGKGTYAGRTCKNWCVSGRARTARGIFSVSV